MAEAGTPVESGTTSQNRFFCHICATDIVPQLPDYLCPTYQNGFIESIEAMDASHDSDSDSSDMEAEFWELLGNGPASENVLSNTQSNGRNNEASQPRRSQRFRGALHPRGRRGRGFHDRHQTLVPLLQDLVMQVTSGGGLIEASVGGGAGADFGGLFPGGAFEIPMLVTSNLASNAGDYAWGRGGLDAIITQMMNQLDGTGPPPLPQEKIDSIPTVKITQEQCDKNLQCTVCMEDYKLGESVRKLNCEHCYHDECIIPWLQLHGTCPICRKALTCADYPSINSYNDSTENPRTRYSTRASENSNTTANTTSPNGPVVSTRSNDNQSGGSILNFMEDDLD